MHGLAVPGTVICDSSLPAVQPDQAVEQCQAPGGFVRMHQAGSHAMAHQHISPARNCS